MDIFLSKSLEREFAHWGSYKNRLILYADRNTERLNIA
jgi:hypothetical protein